MNIRVISILISVTLIALLYWQIDINKVIQVLLKINLTWLFFGLMLVIPITLLTAFRLTFLSIYLNKINYFDALKLILAASVMNLVLPSKMGDLAKGVFIAKDKNIAYSQAFILVIFEKISDLLALLLWCIVGLIFLQNYSNFYIILLSILLILLIFGTLAVSSKLFVNKFFLLIIFILPGSFFSSVSNFQKEWLEAIIFITKDKNFFWTISLLSIFLWFLHLLQIWLFILSLSSNVGFLISLAITPLAIFAGLIPLTFSGIGTRDFAFIYFYAAYFSPVIGAALGVLATLRYIIPAIVGIPFFSRYMKNIR